MQSFDDLPKSVRDRAKRDGVEPGDLRGIYSGGSTYVVADNHANVAEAVYTAVHEEVGHRGIRDMLGGKLTPQQWSASIQVMQPLQRAAS